MFITSLRHWRKFLKYWYNAESGIWTKKQNKNSATISHTLITNPPCPSVMAATLTATTRTPHTLTLHKKAGSVLHGVSPQSDPKPQPTSPNLSYLTTTAGTEAQSLPAPHSSLLPRPSLWGHRQRLREAQCLSRPSLKKQWTSSRLQVLDPGLYICIFLNLPEQINSSPSYQDGGIFVFWKLCTVTFSF